ncbi:PAN domain protein [Cooperia oncophora]
MTKIVCSAFIFDFVVPDFAVREVGVRGMRHLFILILLIRISFEKESPCNPFYVRWPRVRLNFKPVANARLSLRACENACSLGEDPQMPGRLLECAALNHHPSPDGYAHHCDVFQPHQLQNVDGYVEADDRYSFYWKYCLNTTRKCGGEYAFTYHSDRYMDARDVTRVVKKGSLEECLVECLDEKTVPCRSISFNRTDGGCHVSADSQLTKPQAIHLNNNPNFRIDYYENNCYNCKLCDK